MALRERKGMLVTMAYLVLSAIMVVGTLGGYQAKAAAKASLQTKSATMALGGKTIIVIKNKANGAKYTYKIKNPNVASVSAKGAVVGKAIGKTVVTVEQNDKGKLSKVGSFKINIIKSKLNQKETELFVDESLTGKEFVQEFISNYSSKAKYKLTSSKSSVVKVSATGTLKAVSEGSANITVKEVYNGKTRVVGAIKVVVTADEEEYEDYEDDYEDEEDEDYEDEDVWEDIEE